MISIVEIKFLFLFLAIGPFLGLIALFKKEESVN